MQKSVVIKQTWAIILMTPHYLLEASGAPAFTLQQGGWITVHKRRFFLKERLSVVYITLENSASVHRNWTLICFATSWGSGLDRCPREMGTPQFGDPGPHIPSARAHKNGRLE